MLPCLFNLYAKYIMRNAGLDEVQSGIMTSGRNITISDMQMTHTTLMAKSEEELKSLLMKVKEESEKADKYQHSNKKYHGICSYDFMASVLPVNIQDWFPLGWTGWISL